MSDLTVDGMALAPGVVETIVSIAVADVDGVASVGNAPRQAAASAACSAASPPRPVSRSQRTKTTSCRSRCASTFIMDTCCPTWRLRFASLWRTPWQARWARRLDRSTSTSMASSSTVRNKKKHRGLFAHGIERHERTTARRVALQVLYTAEIKGASAAQIVAEGVFRPRRARFRNMLRTWCAASSRTASSSTAA